jgi:hypothetical protein
VTIADDDAPWGFLHEEARASVALDGETIVVDSDPPAVEGELRSTGERVTPPWGTNEADPSTAGVTFDARSTLHRYDDARPRTQQVTLGPSDLDRCLRQSGYRHHGVEASNPRSASAARIGTLMHLGYAALLREVDDPEVGTEVPLAVSGTKIVGHADSVNWATHVVEDLKTVSGRSWDRIVTFGPRDAMWNQVQMYAYALDNAGYTDEWVVRLLIFNRETGEEAVFEREADLDLGHELIERLAHRQDVLDFSDSPDSLPREGKGPGRGFPCDWCDWTDLCWPPREDDLSPQSAQIVGDAALVQEQAEAYIIAAEEARQAKRRQDDARAFLEGIPAGDYGTTRLAWRGGQNEAKPKVDVAALIQTATAAGLPIPMTAPSLTTVRINLTRVPPDAPAEASPV